MSQNLGDSKKERLLISCKNDAACILLEDNPNVFVVKLFGHGRNGPLAQPQSSVYAIPVPVPNKSKPVPTSVILKDRSKYNYSTISLKPVIKSNSPCGNILVEHNRVQIETTFSYTELGYVQRNIDLPTQIQVLLTTAKLQAMVSLLFEENTFSLHDVFKTSHVKSFAVSIAHSIFPLIDELREYGFNVHGLKCASASYTLVVQYPGSEQYYLNIPRETITENFSDDSKLMSLDYESDGEEDIADHTYHGDTESVISSISNLKPKRPYTVRIKLFNQLRLGIPSEQSKTGSSTDMWESDASPPKKRRPLHSKRNPALYRGLCQTESGSSSCESVSQMKYPRNDFIDYLLVREEESTYQSGLESFTSM